MFHVPLVDGGSAGQFCVSWGVSCGCSQKVTGAGVSNRAGSLASHSDGDSWNTRAAGPLFLPVKISPSRRSYSRVADFLQGSLEVPKVRVETDRSSRKLNSGSGTAPLLH